MCDRQFHISWEILGNSLNVFLEIWETKNINNHPRIKTNFKELFNDLEFWNILTLKTETFFIELGRVEGHKRTFLLIEKYLNQYLDNK